MAKLIAPNELAEIVTGLLINPALLGELDSVERHQAFIKEIADVVTYHCCGYINGINSSNYVSVSPYTCMDSLTRNVWAAFDVEGWKEWIAKAMDKGADIPQPLTQDAINSLRAELQQLLPLTAKRLDTDY